jgi:hypothetical protein
MEFCPTTTNGFPLNVIGEIDENASYFPDLQDTADTYISFGNFSLPRKLYARPELDSQRWKKCFLDESTQTSLTSNGLSYNIKAIQFCAPTHSGSTWPRKPTTTSSTANRIDMVMTFSRTDIGTTDPSVFLVIVPIYLLSELTTTRTSSPVAEEFFKTVVANTNNTAPVVIDTKNYPSLQPLFFDLGDQAAVKYVTCIQLRPPQPKPSVWTMKYLNMAVLYFPAGWIIKDPNILKALGANNDMNFSPYILPGEARGPNFLTPRIQPVKEGASEEVVNQYVSDTNNWSAFGELTGNSISVTNTEFISRFRWIKNGFAASKAEKRLKSTFEYQCLPLDKAKDIDGTNVLLDPATGTRSLASELDGSSSGENKKQLEELSAAGSATRTFAIVMGTIFGILVLFIILSYVVSWFTTRKESKEGQDIIIKAAAYIGTTAAAAVAKSTPPTPTPNPVQEPSKVPNPSSEPKSVQISKKEQLQQEQDKAILEQISKPIGQQQQQRPQRPQDQQRPQRPQDQQRPQRPQGRRFGRKRGGEEEEIPQEV